MFWKTVSGKHVGKQFVFMSFLMALLSGCSSLATKDSSTTSPSSEAGQADCQSLSTLFSKSNNNFESIRYRPSYKNKITLWESRYQLIENSCQVWQWGDKYSYVCNEAYPDQETAQQVYQQAQGFINQCLGENPSGWYEEQGVLEGRGEETQYLFEGQVRGSLRKQSTPGLFRDSWSVYFWIDSPSMLR
ncbi:hypothetical protein [Endozoicomonas elysicola]|uniref:Lipoprotein n=1 Tax=Endozoicomonas elysicola TaxID=305900 RepID=A0A081KFT4_9GAMM|nr:hypothetical protein [Endozoicomonas elysicola]KEI73010.1 hypothetical protein GV64_21865 [Endozoicomonas elysicola]